MNVSKSEIFDKFTITRLKKKRSPRSKKIKEQFNLYKAETDSILHNLNITKQGLVNKLLTDLYKINGKIWDLQDKIRGNPKSNLPLQEIGKLAIMIVNLNDKRVRIKNRISKLFNEHFFEEVRVYSTSLNSKTKKKG